MWKNVIRSNSPFQSFRHGPGLFENFLLHVVPVFPAQNGVRGEIGLFHRAVGKPVFAVPDFVAPGAQANHITLFQIDESVGDGKQGMNIRCQVMFMEANAQHQGTASPGADNDTGFAGADHGNGIGALQSFHCLADCAKQIIALGNQLVNQVHH